MAMAATGCSRADLNKALEEAKAKTSSLTESAVSAVEDQLPPTGSISLRLSPPVEIAQAQVSVTVIGNGRPNVVQVASYDVSVNSHGFPAMLLQGTTGVSSCSELAGQSVECDMYYQNSFGSKIAMTKPGLSVRVVFDSVNEQDNTISATVEAVELLSSDETTLSVGGAQITAVVRDGNH